jgi:hypothetical protein
MIKLKYILLKNLVPIALIFLIIEMFFTQEISGYVKYISYQFFIIIYIYLLGINILIKSFNSAIGFFLLFLLVLIIISSLSGHFWWSNIFKWQSIFLIFFSYYLGFHLFNSEQRIKILTRQTKHAAIIYIIYFVVIQFLDFNVKSYETYSGIFNIGSISSRRLLFLSYTIITLFFGFSLYYNNSLKRLSYLLLLMVLFSISIIILRRTVIVISIIGILIFAINNINFKKIFLLIFYTAIAVSIFVFTLEDIFQTQLNYRKEQTGFSNTFEEARFTEFLLLSAYINHGTDKQILFGNSDRFVTLELWEKYAGVYDRAIHSDFVYLIYSSGFIGFILYVIVYYSLIRKQRKLKAKLKRNSINDKNIKPLNAIFYSLIISNLLLLYSGSFLYLLHGMISFLFIGASSGYIKKLNSAYYAN